MENSLVFCPFFGIISKIFEHKMNKKTYFSSGVNKTKGVSMIDPDFTFQQLLGHLEREPNDALDHNTIVQIVLRMDASFYNGVDHHFDELTRRLGRRENIVTLSKMLFAKMIQSGMLVNDAYQHTVPALLLLGSLFATIPELQADKAFLDLVKGVREKAISQGAISQADIFDSMAVIRPYLTKLQATMKYEPYAGFISSANDEHVRARVTQTDIVYADRFNADVVHHYEQLSQAPGKGVGIGMVAMQNIRGDGNCYYRSILRSHIEQIVMMKNPDRANLFRHLSNIMSGELLKDGSLFRQHHPDKVARLVELIAKLNAAADGTTWNTVQAFWHDLVDNTEQGDDYALILASRFLVGQYITDHQDFAPNGLSIRDAMMFVSSDGETFDGIINEKILTMGECAEGAHVDMAILQTMIDQEGNLVILPREQGYAVTLQPVATDRAGLRKTMTNLLFRPGHYDYMYNQEQYAELTAAQENAPFQAFNFSGISAALVPDSIDSSSTIKWLSAISGQKSAGGVGQEFVEPKLTAKEIRDVLNQYKTNWILWQVCTFCTSLFGWNMPHESEEIKALRNLVDLKRDDAEIDTAAIINALRNKSFFAADRSVQFVAEQSKPKPVEKEDGLSTDEVVSSLASTLSTKGRS